jgi:hypothetical protein
MDPVSAFVAETEAAPTWFSVRVDDRGKLPICRDRKIVFHGVNKSGSLCLTKVLMDAYVKENRKGEFHSHYHLPGVSLHSFLELVKATPAPGFFVGHQLFGNVELNDSDAVMITQFRHPLPRMMSCYEWLRKKHSVKTGSAEGFPDFETFVKQGAGKSHSQIIQFGAGYGEEKRRLLVSLTARDLFERSIENIERYVCFAGIAELFEETIFAVAHLCGISRVSAWKRDERNAGRPMASTLPQSSVELLREVYRYDFELYDWAKRRFEALMRKIKISGEIEAYKQKCASQYMDRLLTSDDSFCCSGSL